MSRENPENKEESPNNKFKGIQDRINKRVDSAEETIKNLLSQSDEPEEVRQSWFECFEILLSLIESDLKEIDITILSETEDEYSAQLTKHLLIMENRIKELKEKYPDREYIPNDKIKEELFTIFKKFKT